MATLEVAVDDNDRRLDRVLRNGFPGVPPGAIAGAIRRGEIRVNGMKTRGETRVRTGDRISVPDWDKTGRGDRRPQPLGSRPPHARGGGERSGPRERTRDRGRPAPRSGGEGRGPHDRRGAAPPPRAQLRDNRIVRGSLGIDIIERTKDWLVINKPPGTRAHGTDGLDTLVREVAAAEGWWQESLSFRPGPVHRLDTGTSGVQLFSLSTEGARRLTEALRHRQVTKLYLAVVAGSIPRSLEIDRRLAYDRGARRAIAEPDEGPAPALRFASARTTVLPVMSAGGGSLSLVAAVPHTGRTHQIRAHLAALGHPLVGDGTYNGPDWSELAGSRGKLAERQRMLLHALYLGLTSGETAWTAPLRAEDYALVRTLFGDPSGVVQRLNQIRELACTSCRSDTTIRL